MRKRSIDAGKTAIKRCCVKYINSRSYLNLCKNCWKKPCERVHSLVKLEVVDLHFAKLSSNYLWFTRDQKVAT